MTRITIRQGTAAGTQGAGHEYLQKVKGFIGAVAYELSPYFGPMRPMSLDHAGLSVKDRILLVVVQFEPLPGFWVSRKETTKERTRHSTVPWPSPGVRRM